MILPHSATTIVYRFHVFDIEDRAPGGVAQRPGALLGDQLISLTDKQGLFHLFTAVFGSQLSANLSDGEWKAKFAGRKYASDATIGYRTAAIAAEQPAALAGLRATPGDYGWFATSSATFRFVLVATVLAEPGSADAQAEYPVVADAPANGVPQLDAEARAGHLSEAEMKEATVFRKHVGMRSPQALLWTPDQDLLLRLCQRAGLKCREAWEGILMFSLLTRTYEATENRYSTTHTKYAEEVEATAKHLSKRDCLLAARRLGRRLMQAHFRKGVSYE